MKKEIGMRKFILGAVMLALATPAIAQPV